ncbi:MAG: D-(-)-3-hydroxybutyrate oligomer hydrolase, partial [Pseudomonadota bacterium]|nr:D-(-)-3-hydroxybutyrate oligomer hydrolase [Pseudomonadota bacterium]
MRSIITRRLRNATSILAASAAILAAGLPAFAADQPPPAFIEGPVSIRHFGDDNDLLTAGLGWSGIQNGVAPAVSDPPTPDELRRLAIYTSMRGLISTSATEGFGSIYGTLGPVSGAEYMAFVKGADGPAATVLVQIPDNLNTTRPCIVTAPSSGSRGIYGAISNAEVAFKNGCAVAYTDKGTGVGFHDLTRDVVYDLDGTARRSSGTPLAQFRAEATPALAAFKAEFPHRIAMKHAHSGQNPERDWGKFVLLSIRFALWAVNDNRVDGGRNWTPADVRVVAAGVSNGGGAALVAAEEDEFGLIDGIVVSEPQVQPRRGDFVIRDRGGELRAHSRGLYDI